MAATQHRTSQHLDNARRLLDGEPLLNVVDTVEFY